MKNATQTIHASARDIPNCPPPPPRNLDTLVRVTRWRAENQHDETSITFLVDGEREEEHLTYGGLDCRARAIAAELQARGAQGERVLLMFNPGLDYCAAVFGCLYAGAVAVPVYPPDPFRAQRTLPRLQAIVEDSQARLVFSSQEILEWAGRSIEESCRTPILPIETIPPGRELQWRPTADQAAEIALVQYTSGSTGRPRGVVLTHANLMHNLRSLHRIDSPGVVAVSWLPPYHDMGLIGCLLLPVHSGRRVVLMSPLAFVQRPARWLEAISRYGGKTSAAPNFGYELCIRKVLPEECEGLDLSSWTVAVSGAEPVRAETIDRFAEKFGRCGFRREAFYPAYGMAESTLLVASGHRDDPPVVRTFQGRAFEQNLAAPVDPADPSARRLVGCGQPVPDGEITIVDPKSLVRLGPGQVGEIWVQSPSVGIGYWNRPEETEAMFHATPAGESGPGYLRTGDLGFIDQGELFVTGRLKELIILSGRNHYPQDIERTVQRCHEAFKADGGAAFSIERDGEERLVVVQEVTRPKKHDLAELVSAVRRELAEEFELSPDAVVLIASGTLPKTSSGKTRRRACREMFLDGHLVALAEWRAGTADTAGSAGAMAADPPQGEIECALAGLWSEVLGIGSLGRTTDFFALGGHSLRGVQLLARIQEEFAVEMPLRQLFEQPTIAEGAAWIESARAGEESARPHGLPVRIPRREADQPTPLSSAEMRLWFFDQLQPNHPVYNMPVAARLVGPLDAERLARCLKELARRHDTLRTSYPSEDGRPWRRIDAEAELSITRVDLESLPAGERQAELDRLVREESRKPFDLAAGPPVRCVLYRLGPQEHVVLLAMHHIIVDGWSIGVMLREMAAMYDAFAGGESSPLAPLDIEYADFAAWQQQHVAREVLDREFAYWEKLLGDEPPLLDLPTDRPRPSRPSFAGALRPFELSAELTTRLHELARREHTTPFAVLLAAYDTLLARYCRQTDIAVGTVVANRTRRELEPVVGFFANTLVLRTDLSGDPTFRKLVRHAGERTLEAYSHQELPFEKLVELLRPQRFGGQAPLFQAALVLENMPLDLESMTGLRIEPLAVDTGTAKYDLALLLSEQSGRLVGQAEYSTALFDEATIDRMLVALKTLLAAALEDPDRKIDQLPLVDEAEHRRLVCGGGVAAAAETSLLTLHGLFEQEAAANPDRAAIRCARHEMTYGELDRRANRLARLLLARGVRPEEPVTVCLERSAELVVAMLGVLKAGAVYVPVDPDQPRDRLAFLFQDTKSPVILTERAWLDRLPSTSAQVVLFEDLATDAGDPSPPETAVAPDQLAYIIYTSGSTGRPKGALVEHRGVVNFMRQFCRAMRIGAGSRVLQFFSPSSDGSISDVFSALAGGACLVIAGGQMSREADALEDLIRRERVTAATVTPSILQLLRPEELPHLASVCSVGEPLSAELAAKWSPGRLLINGYGVSEAAIGACLTELNGSNGSRPPIGRPLENVWVYVLDDRLQPVPVGVPGEICLGGVQVGRGYLNRPERTARQFVPDPFRDDPGARLYRTGDLGRLRPDGMIDFLGRIDDQVKMRGYRIEPGEIASLLRRHPAVGQAAVIVREDQPGSSRLVAYITPRLDDAGRAGEETPEGRELLRLATQQAVPQLHAYLEARLPAHMVPSAVVVLDALPRSVHGKLDRRALPPPVSDRPGWSAGYVAPRDPEEAVVAAVWEELLEVRPIGAADNFFALGGHSLLAVRVMAEIERRTGRRLPLASLFHGATVEYLAKLLREPETCRPEDSLVPLQPEGDGRPFFCIHPAGGTVFCYRPLAKRLGHDRPFYGLQAMGVDGNVAPHERVEDMGAHYTAAIRSVQPHGPYLLGGWSLGGNLAFETARQLAEEGEEIALLALFDTAALLPDREPDQRDFLPLAMDFFPDDENLPLAALERMTWQEQLEYFVKRAGQAQLVLDGGDLSAGRHVFEVFRASMRAIINYRQKVYPGPATLFAAAHNEDLFYAAHDADFGWGAWAQGGVEVYHVPGGHIRMVLEPHVEVLAEKLRECLARADRRTKREHSAFPLSASVIEAGS
ncbi:MAG: amino acid adenylation domain-containing protein [Pirellulales bacterium]